MSREEYIIFGVGLGFLALGGFFIIGEVARYVTWIKWAIG